MNKEGLISISFTEEEKAEFNSHLKGMETLIANKCISLTPEQRKEYARLGNRTENWSRKVMDYMRNQPEFNPTFVDLDATEKDVDTRNSLKPFLNQLNSLSSMIDDTMIALGADIYQSNTAYYQNIKLLSKQQVNGAKAIYEDLASQFPRRGRKAKPEESNS